VLLTETATRSESRLVLQHRRRALVPVALGALAMLASVTGSWVPSLWGDEAASQLAARRSLTGLFQLVQHVDAVHGTYYLFLHFWVKVFGYGPFAIRFPSSVAMGVCVGLVVWLCIRVATMRLAVLAGVICAVLPRLTYAGAEARSFAFDAAVAAGLCVLVVEIIRRPGRHRRLWGCYGMLLAVGTYLFLYTGLVTFAVGVFLLVTPSVRRHWRGWLIASVCGLGAAVPILIMAFLERAQISYLKGGDYASWDVLFKQMWFGDVTFAVVGWTLIGVAVLALGWQLIRIKRGWPAPDASVLALSWVAVPTGLLLIANAVFPLFTARYAAITAPAAGILIAAGIQALARVVARVVRYPAAATWACVVLTVAVVVVASPNWAGQRGPYSENQSDWNEVAATVRAHSQPGDGIMFDGGARPSRRPRLALDTAAPGAFGPVRDVLLKTPFTRNDTWYAATYSVKHAVERGRFDHIHRVWVVEYRTPSGLSVPHRPDSYGLAALEKLGYRKADAFSLHASVVYLLTKTP
jgi:mannosyltransferase